MARGFEGNFTSIKSGSLGGFVRTGVGFVRGVVSGVLGPETGDDL